MKGDTMALRIAIAGIKFAWNASYTITKNIILALINLFKKDK